MSAPSASDILDDDAPLWLINEQIKGLLEGDGAGEDHQDVLDFLRQTTGLPEGTILRIHRAIVHGDTSVLPEQRCTPGVTAIANERRRQIEAEGWTPEHDAQHRDGSLTMAAICYAEWEHYEHPNGDDTGLVPINWPWTNDWWKPAGRVRNLEKAGALIAAELDQLIRKEATNG
jgi:hypothetical protein